MFVADKIRYTDIFEIMDKCVCHFGRGVTDALSVEDIISADAEAKRYCLELV